MSSALGGFFSGGAKGITWPDRPDVPGGRTVVTGVIETVHDPEPVIDMVTGNPTDKMQVRIVLKTEERDPTEPDDDGRRTLYVKSWMRGAVGEALRKAGAKEPQVGGTLSVQFVGLIPAERPGLNPGKKFAATYSAPASAAGQYLGGGQPAAQPQQQYVPPQQQQYVPPQQPVQQQIPQPVAQQPVAQPIPQPQAVAGPVKPAAISDAAWAAMDPATQATVAATMAPAASPSPAAPPY